MQPGSSSGNCRSLGGIGSEIEDADANQARHAIGFRFHWNRGLHSLGVCGCVQGMSHLYVRLPKLLNLHPVCRSEYPHRRPLHHFTVAPLLCRYTRNRGRALPYHPSYPDRIDPPCSYSGTIFTGHNRGFGSVQDDCGVQH